MTRTLAISLARTSLLLSTLCFAPLLHAQQPQPPTQPQPQHRGMQDRGDEGRDRDRDRDRMAGGGMGIVPPGTWWRRPEVIQKLTLTTDQQKRLDDILLQSRIQLLHMKASLEEEQLKLEPLLNANPPDAGRTLAQISKVADLRADLEKANAKMLLGLRGVLTADQWTKLQMHDHAGRGDRRGPGGQGGPDQRGPGQMGGPGGNVGNPPMPPAKNDE